MGALIAAAMDRNRTTLLVLLFVLFSGVLAFISIPKEADPDVAIPIIYVSIPYDGISPDDAVRLLVRPMENELKNIIGIKEMKSVGREGQASVTMEFEAGFDSESAMQDVREKVDTAKASLPADTEEPTVHEVNVALFPVMNIALSGAIPERVLLRAARDLQEELESLAGVLEVDIGGDREELMEIIIEPQQLESYQLDFSDVLRTVTSNNQLVAAGSLDGSSGRQVLKVPGIVEGMDDMLDMPLFSTDGTVVKLSDIAKVRKTFKDPQSFARVGGESSMVLAVKKNLGANIIDTIEEVRQVVEARAELWPRGLEYSYTLDQSNRIKDMLNDLLNNVLSGIILVMIIVLAVMGLRSSLLVGLAIPGSFLTGILVLNTLGYTLNVIVLFSLILVVGMLVDGAIVVIELADRRIKQGMPAKQAFLYAATRMSWPVFAATLTTLVVFMPLMFWPGVIGEFMKYLPITVLICLTSSLFMALIFVPVLGGTFIRHQANKAEHAGDEDALPASSFNQGYTRILGKLLLHPAKVLLLAIGILIGSYASYGAFGNGVEFFPDIEPDTLMLRIHARGDLSIYQKDQLLKDVEHRVLNIEGIKSVYANSFNSAGGGSGNGPDVVAQIQFQLDDWQQRPKAKVLLAQMKELTKDIAGIELEFVKDDGGPGGGKPIELLVSAYQYDDIYPVVAKIRSIMSDVKGIINAEDNRPLPGIEWRLNVDRTEAERYGANVALVGSAVQLVTGGIRVTDYRPETSDDVVDIRLRFPRDKRNLDQLMQMQVRTETGMVPLANFASLEPAAKTGNLNRVDSRAVVTIQAEAAEGYLVSDLVTQMQKKLAELEIAPDVKLQFKGEDEDQRETGDFLTKAFGIALFLMALVLVTQFNSLYQTFLILSAILFSTAGVLLGLLLTNQPFGIVMGGVGIIALAGIVVNNNIVLIDCYNDLKNQGHKPYQAALLTGSLRLRPVLLTAVTTVLGLMPMVLSMNIDLIDRQISFGAPSTQWWTQLASSIAGGLTFATLLTLFLTPCLLVLGDRKSVIREFISRKRKIPTRIATPN